MNIAAAIATLFGIGRAPYAPGTVASLAALPFAWVLAMVDGRAALLFAAIFATAIGGWASEHYVREKGDKDPSDCVIDELAGQWIACAFAPRSLLGFGAAFVFFRALDIAKPWPLSAAEKLPGGLGVMADDVIAGIIAGLLVAVLGHAGIV